MSATYNFGSVSLIQQKLEALPAVQDLFWGTDYAVRLARALYGKRSPQEYWVAWADLDVSGFGTLDIAKIERECLEYLCSDRDFVRRAYVADGQLSALDTRGAMQWVFFSDIAWGITLAFFLDVAIALGGAGLWRLIGDSAWPIIHFSAALAVTFILARSVIRLFLFYLGAISEAIVLLVRCCTLVMMLPKALSIGWAAAAMGGYVLRKARLVSDNIMNGRKILLSWVAVFQLPVVVFWLFLRLLFPGINYAGGNTALDILLVLVYALWQILGGMALLEVLIRRKILDLSAVSYSGFAQQTKSRIVKHGARELFSFLLHQKKVAPKKWDDLFNALEALAA